MSNDCSAKIWIRCSSPRHTRVRCGSHRRTATSADRAGPHASGQTFTSVIGKPLGTETYRITISGGTIIDRRRVEADDICASESYEPV